MWKRLLRVSNPSAATISSLQKRTQSAQQHAKQATARLPVVSGEQNGQKPFRITATTAEGLRNEHVYRRDTIAALSSGAGRCGVALLRVSGPEAGKHIDHTVKWSTRSSYGLLNMQIRS